MLLYKSISDKSSGELLVQKSRFLSYAMPVKSEDEARAFIASIKALNKQANHHPAAFSIGDKGEVLWTSDDGEPAGTSGAPILSLLTGQGLSNIVIVVSRYFGGIKLGKGGLVRAYQDAAALALESSRIAMFYEGVTNTIEFDYTYLNRITRALSGDRVSIGTLDYGEHIKIEYQVLKEFDEETFNLITEISSGGIKLISKNSSEFIKYV